VAAGVYFFFFFGPPVSRSHSVVRGLRRTCRLLTKRPVTALRPRPAPVPFLAIAILLPLLVAHRHHARRLRRTVGPTAGSSHPAGAAATGRSGTGGQDTCDVAAFVGAGFGRAGRSGFSHRPRLI
jgi:hypothetical protein